MRKCVLGFVSVAIILIATLSLCACGGGSSSNDSGKAESMQFDSLQQLFISTTFDVTADQLESAIQQSGLAFSKEDYENGKRTTYRIAATEGAAKQKYADSGDYLDVSFDNEANGSFAHAQYVSAGNGGSSALLYHHGEWYSFSGNNAEDYSGYYHCISLGGKKDGIVVKYANGRQAETDYHKCQTADEAVKKVLEYKKK